MSNRILNSRKGSKTHNQFTHPWTKKEIEFIRKNLHKMTYKEMGKTINRTPTAIQSKVRHLPFKKKVKKYPINKDFFQKWTQEMAYILGFIAADGNISKHGRAHMIQLASDDKDIIYKIRKAIKSKASILQRKRCNGKISYQLRFSDQTIFNDLLRLNITTRKSQNITPPEIPSKYVRHYLRGFFDGDGTVYSTKKAPLVTTWYTASEPMAKFIFSHITKVCPEFKGRILITPTPTGTSKYYSITLCKRDSRIMFQYLYKNASIYLDRKYKKYLEKVYVN
jgi:intein/homing endonuclease